MTLELENSDLHIRGTILTVSDFEAIKNKIESIKDKKKVTLKVHDSLVINSSLIGYLVKLINQENMEVNIEAGSSTLIELLEDIGLSSTFHLKSLD